MNHKAQQFLNNRLQAVLYDYLPSFELLEEARQIRWRIQDILDADPTIKLLTLVLRFLVFSPRTGAPSNTQIGEIVVKVFPHGDDVNVIAFSHIPGDDETACVLTVNDDGTTVEYKVYGAAAKPFDYAPRRSLTYYSGAYSTEHELSPEVLRGQ